ncbi:MAG: glycerate kinase [Firmicutes bacterium]|nr:glycerate kinase [Bacillota bacterium]
MKPFTVLVACDAFKGALNQAAVVEAIAAGLRRGYPSVRVDACPLADGGEGSSLLMQARGGQVHSVTVADAYGAPHVAHWVSYQGIALVESAEGSPYVPPDRRPAASALTTTSRGTGELIQAALEHPEVREVWVALGGTGCVDGGIGLLGALGAKFYDSQGRQLAPVVGSWAKVLRVVLPRLAKPLVGLADVWVPLLGVNGALERFGPQKGLRLEEMAEAEAALQQFAESVRPGLADHPGAGAAGGIGFALLALGASLQPGARWWAEWSHLPQRIAASDVVITGEGRLDEQSLMGKVVSIVLEEGRRQQKPVVVLAGEIPDDLTPFYAAGLTSAWSIVTGPVPLRDALAKTEGWLREAGERLGRLFAVGQPWASDVQRAHRKPRDKEGGTGGSPGDV